MLPHFELKSTSSSDPRLQHRSRRWQVSDPSNPHAGMRDSHSPQISPADIPTPQTVPGQGRLVRYLLGKGADANVADEDGKCRPLSSSAGGLLQHQW
jgi:hypothetical protein